MMTASIRCQRSLCLWHVVLAILCLRAAVNLTVIVAAAMAAAAEGPGKADGTLDTAAGRQLVVGTLQPKTDTPKKQTSLGRFF